MKQKTLLAGLIVFAIVALLGSLLLMGRNGPLAALIGEERVSRANIDASRDAQEPDEKPEDESSAETYEFISDKKFDGRDEYGPYRLTKDGRKIYVDEHGRPLKVQPGKKTGAGSASDPSTGSDRPHSGTGSSGTKGTGNPEEKPKDPAEESREKISALIGRVVNEIGEAVKSANVSVSFQGGSEPARHTATSDEGRFRFENLTQQVMITVQASDGKGNVSKPLRTKLAEGTTDTGDLVLPRDSGIRGTIINAELNSPVEGATVTLQGAVGYRDLKSVKTLAGGRFEFAPLTPGNYRVKVTCEGFTPRILNNVSPPCDLQVDLSPGVVIAGVVIADDDQKPVSGALIYCDFHSEPNQNFHTETTSDQDGNFAVKCQPESVHNVITCVAAGFSKFTQNFVKSGVGDLVVRMKRSPNGLVRGRLVNASLQPVTSAQITARKANGKAAQVLQKTGPDSEGKFWCEVALDAAQLVIAPPGMPSKAVDIAPIAGQEQYLGDIILTAGVVVYGKITEVATKVAIAGAKVSAANRNATSDALGAYRLEGLPETEFNFGVNHVSHLGWAQKVTPAQGQTEIELNIELRVAEFHARVHVSDATTGASLAGVSIKVIDYGQTVVTDEGGGVKIKSLSSYKPNCEFTLAGYVSLTAPITTYLPDEVDQKPVNEIKLVQGSTIKGRCTTQGSPLPGGVTLEIWMINAQGVLVRPAQDGSAQTDSDGKYATGNLPPGKYYVGIAAYHVAPRPVTVPSEGGATLDLEIGAVCHLRGYIKRADGSAHANQGVYVHSKAHLYHCATFYTGPSGEFEVQNLWAGTFMFTPLKTQGDSSAQFTVEVTLAQAGWNEKTLNLPLATGIVEGRVTYTDGAPVVGARVSITNLSMNWERACLAGYVVTDAQGKYRAERMENGASMIARVGGYGDEADTATAFSEIVNVPNNNSAVTADIVVARTGVSLSGKVRRADGGPLPAWTILYLVDAQGRLSGLYFGGSGANGAFTCGDVSPGSYRLIACNEALERAEIQIEVGTKAIGNLDLVMKVDR